MTTPVSTPPNRMRRRLWLAGWSSASGGRCRQCDQIHHRHSRDGRTVVDALRHFASTVTQPRCDVGGLNALSDSCHVKRVSQLDDGPDDGLGARICQYVDDQVLVEFDFIYGQLAQIRQSRVAAAEVIEGNVNTAFLQGFQYIAGSIDVLQK